MCMSDKKTDNGVHLIIGGKKYTSDLVVKTSVTNDKPTRLSNVKTQEDISASYQKFAERDIKQSEVRVNNIGSQKAVVDNVTKNLVRTIPNQQNQPKQIKSNLTLSYAFNASLNLRKVTKHYSKDAKKSLYKVKRYVNGNVGNLNTYLMTKPQTKSEKFTYKVVRRQLNADVARSEIAKLELKPTLKNGVKSIGKEAFATYNETLLRYATHKASSAEWLRNKIKNGAVSSVSSAVGSASGYMLSSDDLGAKTVGGMLIAGQGAVTVGKGVAKAYVFVTDIPTNLKNLPSNARRVVGGAVTGARYAISNAVSTGYAIKTGVSRTITFAKHTADTIKVNGLVSKVTLSKVGYTLKTGAKQGAILAGRGVTHTAVKGGVTLVKKGIPSAVKGADRLSLGIGSALSRSDNEYIRGSGQAMTTVNYGIKTSVTVSKTSGYAVKTAVTKSVNGAKNGYYAVNYVREHGMKSSVEMARAKIRYKAYKKIKDTGVAISKGLEVLASLLTKRLIVPVIVVLVAVCAFTVLIPTVSTVAVMFGGTFSISGIFSGGLFPTPLPDDTDTDTDIVTKDFDAREFLSSTEYGIPKLKDEYIKDFAQYLNNKGASYHYVRLKSHGISDIIETSEDGIKSLFYTDEELLNIIQPIFNSIILTKYELEPTEKQAKDTMKEIFDTLFVEPKKLPAVETTEFCGQDGFTGVGRPYWERDYCVGCRKSHSEYGDALPTCPNYETRYHDSYTCEKCCEEVSLCNERNHETTITLPDDTEISGYGHFSSTTSYMTDGSSIEYIEWTVHGNGVNVDSYHREGIITFDSNGNWVSYNFTSGEYSVQNEMVNCTDYTTEFNCSGYNYCKDHKVLTVTFNVDGFNQLLEDTFEKRITELSNKKEEELTDKEKEELQSLKDGYEICVEHIKLLSDNYVTIQELNTVKWVIDESVDNTTGERLRDIALTQVGTIGGDKYMDWFYSDEEERPKRVEWSGCFVAWCKSQQGITLYDKFATAQDGAKKNSPLLSRDCDEQQAGHIIYLDWDNDGKAQRCGIVIGRDNEYVYAVEGNNSDTVNISKYKLDDPHILGYSN